jgi:hypothetical protein
MDAVIYFQHMHFTTHYSMLTLRTIEWHCLKLKHFHSFVKFQFFLCVRLSAQVLCRWKGNCRKILIIKVPSSKKKLNKCYQFTDSFNRSSIDKGFRNYLHSSSYFKTTITKCVCVCVCVYLGFWGLETIHESNNEWKNEWMSISTVIK